MSENEEQTIVANETKPTDVFKFTFAGKEYKVEKLKGRAARLNMLSFLSLFGELMNMANVMGIDLVGLVSGQQKEDMNIAETIAKILIGVGRLTNTDFFERFEDKLPILLNVPKEVLDEHGDILETYILAVNALLFQIGVNATPASMDTVENF